MEYRHGSNAEYIIEYHFWARGYFCATAGELTKQMIEEYLVHHSEHDPNNKFDIEP